MQGQTDTACGGVSADGHGTLREHLLVEFGRTLKVVATYAEFEVPVLEQGWKGEHLEIPVSAEDTTRVVVCTDASVAVGELVEDHDDGILSGYVVVLELGAGWQDSLDDGILVGGSHGWQDVLEAF